jgi:hypothetical protein
MDVLDPSGNGQAGYTAERTKCKKNALEGDVLAWAAAHRNDPNDLDYTDFDGDGLLAGDDQFCEHFFRGNYLCPATCTACGRDCNANPEHICGQEVGAPGSVCDQVTATCVGT